MSEKDCFYFKANHGIQKQHSINKEIQVFGYCQDVICNVKRQEMMLRKAEVR